MKPMHPPSLYNRARAGGPTARSIDEMAMIRHQWLPDWSRRPLVSDRVALVRALRERADQVFSRSAGAPLVGGNHVRVLRDAARTTRRGNRRSRPRPPRFTSRCTSSTAIRWAAVSWSCWRRARATASKCASSTTGSAVAGVRCFGLFRPLVAAGGEVRVFNPPRLTAALGWTTSNHRKYLCVDGRVTFIGGLCVGRMWEGRPEKRQDPWRDTAVEIRGPATAHGERGFAESWRLAGGTLDAALSCRRRWTSDMAGTTDLRLIYTEPFTAAMLRVDLLVAAMARRRLWIADAYFVGHGPYVARCSTPRRMAWTSGCCCRRAATSGWTVPSRARCIARCSMSGVRVFEWNGSMMHAKTAVADSRWGRIGSTNLNLNSWVGNWELDVAIEDPSRRADDGSALRGRPRELHRDRGRGASPPAPRPQPGSPHADAPAGRRAGRYAR